MCAAETQGRGRACRRVTAPAREYLVAGSSPARPLAGRLAAVSRSRAAGCAIRPALVAARERRPARRMLAHAEMACVARRVHGNTPDGIFIRDGLAALGRNARRKSQSDRRIERSRRRSFERVQPRDMRARAVSVDRMQARRMSVRGPRRSGRRVRRFSMKPANSNHGFSP